MMEGEADAGVFAAGGLRLPLPPFFPKPLLQRTTVAAPGVWRFFQGRRRGRSGGDGCRPCLYLTVPAISPLLHRAIGAGQGAGFPRGRTGEGGWTQGG